MRTCLLAVVFAAGCSASAVDETATPLSAEATTDQPGIVAENGQDWPQFLGPLGTSVSMEKGIIAPWPKEGLKIIWTKEVGTGYSMPTISKGKLYHFDRHGGKARLTCMNSLTGAEQWRFEYPTDYRDKYNYNNGPRCSPIVDDGRVYIHGVEGMLHCLDARDGKVIWKVDERKQFGVVQNFFGVGSTPVVEKDLLIVQVGGSPANSDLLEFGDIKGNGSGVVAFDKRTGKVKYSISDELASYSSPVLATINGRRWCFVLARGGLVAFNPAIGKIDFHFPWRSKSYESVNASNPIVIGNQVFISETYGPGAALLKVRPGGYQIVWDDSRKGNRKSMQCHWMTPIHHDGYVYGSSGRHDTNAELRCIELATGKVMWTEPRLTRSSLLMVDDHFVCLSEDGTVRLLKVNPLKFDVVSEWEPVDAKKESLLKPPCWAAPILVNGLLYLRGDDRLICVELIRKK